MGFNKKFFTTGGIVASSPSAAPFDPLQNFETVTYTGNGSTQKITGHIRKGAAFNGSSSKIAINSLSLTETSVSLWVNMSNLSKENYIFSFNYNATNSFLLFYNNVNEFALIDKAGTGNAVALSSTNPITQNQWHHLALVVTSTTTTLYIDGSAETPASNNRGATAFPMPFELGYATTRGKTAAYFKGKIDQVRIFDRALSQNEVDTLEAETYASSTKSTTDIFGDGSGVALYELDENANDTGVSIDSGQSGVFNGSSSEIQIAATATTPFDSSAKNFTISLWFNLSSNTNDQVIIGKWTSSIERGWQIATRQGANGNTINLYERSGGTGYTYTNTNPYTLNTWHHLVYVRNSTEAIIYIDGQADTFSANYALNDGSTSNIQIGRQQNASGTWLNGKVDQVRIYSSALSSGDISNLYNETSVPTTNLVSWYKLDGNANDSQGSNNGTATAVTYSDPALRQHNGTDTAINYLGMAFQPDFVWLKCRDVAKDHRLYDSVRGATKFLESNNPDAEATAATSLTSFDSNGFTLGAASTTNSNGDDFVAWCWRAAGAANTYNVLENGTVTSDSTASGAGITAGTITTGWEVSANRDAGFSIVSFAGGNSSGTTVGTGLNQPIELLIVKNRDDSSDNWVVWHKDVEQNSTSNSTFTLKGGSTTFLNLTLGSYSYSYDGQMGSTGGENLIAYCFHSVTGYQKVGSYDGTGVANTAIGDTGFLPRWVMIKRTDAGSSNWFILDSIRDTTSPYGAYLLPNASNAENNLDAYSLKFESTRFTVNSTDPQLNALNGTYIYLAIA